MCEGLLKLHTKVNILCIFLLFPTHSLRFIRSERSALTSYKVNIKLTYMCDINYANYSYFTHLFTYTYTTFDSERCAPEIVLNKLTY